jgi:hypothetical protein
MRSHYSLSLNLTVSGEQGIKMSGKPGVDFAEHIILNPQKYTNNNMPCSPQI